MYVNLDNPGLNPHRHFAFLRHHGDDLLVIVVNFGESDDDIRLRIPVHAFECLDLPQGSCKAVELLTGVRGTKTLATGHDMELSVPAHGAAVWKLRRSDVKPLRTPHPTKKS